MTALIGFPNFLPMWPGGSNPQLINFTLNQTTDQLEFIFQAVEAITITRIGFRQGSVTGTAPAYLASLHGVDGSGFPDGTIKGGGSPASVAFTPVAGGNNTWQWKNLDNAYACAIGEWLSLVLSYSSGTVDGSNNCSFGVTTSLGVGYGAPYAIQNDAGSRTKQTATPIFGYGSTGTAYGTPNLTANSVSFSSASSPNERGNIINIPTTICQSYKVMGAILYCQFAAAGAYNVTLYGTDGTTILAQTTYDTDQDSGPTGLRPRAVIFDDAPPTLTAGSTYYLSFAPTTGTQTLSFMTVAASADLDAWPFGQAMCSSAVRSGGAWTLDATTRHGIIPLISDITLGASGGGVTKANLPAGLGYMG